MEYMSTAASHFDWDRFGTGWTRFSPRQSDMLVVCGTISHKLAPVLRTVYEQMTEPKWVMAFGTCTVWIFTFQAVRLAPRQFWMA
jgi:NADH-quinone oxidoreductase subunit B